MRKERLTKQRRREDEVNVRETIATGRRARLPDLSASFSPPWCRQDGIAVTPVDGRGWSLAFRMPRVLISGCQGPSGAGSNLDRVALSSRDRYMRHAKKSTLK